MGFCYNTNTYILLIDILSYLLEEFGIYLENLIEVYFIKCQKYLCSLARHCMSRVRFGGDSNYSERKILIDKICKKKKKIKFVKKC